MKDPGITRDGPLVCVRVWGVGRKAAGGSVGGCVTSPESPRMQGMVCSGGRGTHVSHPLVFLHASGT